MTQATLRISEIFGPTIQGEGALIGKPTVFVRTGGCDYRCTWCDTLYAVESQYRKDWAPMTAEAILAQVKSLTQDTPTLITLSGGNPATQDCTRLIELGQAEGFTFAAETQASIAQDWFKALDWLTLSPKPPSSGMTTDWTRVDACITAAGQTPKISLKIVIADETDYMYAREAAQRFPALPLTLQPCNPNTHSDDADLTALNARMHWLIDRTQKDHWHTVTLLPQLHVYLWGNARGV